MSERERWDDVFARPAWVGEPVVVTWESLCVVEESTTEVDGRAITSVRRRLVGSPHWHTEPS
jgi:hypothetical protein